MDHQKKINFDPTINLGHIITLVCFISAGSGAYWTLDKRVSIQQENNASVKESLNEIKTDVKDMRKAVESVSGAIIKKVLQGV
jgi:cell division protein FtsB